MKLSTENEWWRHPLREREIQDILISWVTVETGLNNSRNHEQRKIVLNQYESLRIHTVPNRAFIIMIISHRDLESIDYDSLHQSKSKRRNQTLSVAQSYLRYSNTGRTYVFILFKWTYTGKHHSIFHRRIPVIQAVINRIRSRIGSD